MKIRYLNMAPPRPVEKSKSITDLLFEQCQITTRIWTFVGATFLLFLLGTFLWYFTSGGGPCVGF